MSKKILYFGKMDFPFNNASACRIMGVSSALVNAGYECFNYGYTKGTNYCGEADGIKYENLQYPTKLFQYLKAFGSKKNIKKVLSRFNSNEIAAIFFTSIGHVQLKYLGKWCSKRNIPLIYDCGDIIRHSTKHVIYKIISHFEFKIFNKIVKRYASTMAISSYIKDFYKDCKYTFIVPCIASKKTERINVPNSEEINKQYLNIGYFGVPGKGFNKDRLDWCLKAFNEIDNKNIRFYVAGPEEKDLPFDCQKIKNVIYKGKLSNSECISLIKSLDFVVFFRENNEICKAGFPSKVTEAFLCDVSVMTNLTSDLGLYLNKNNSLNVDGFTYNDCKILFDELGTIDRKTILEKKSYILNHNDLESSKWSGFLKENIEHIKNMLVK